jgi:hypothetical protein
VFDVALQLFVKIHHVPVNPHVGVHYLAQMALMREGCSDDQMLDVSFYALPL